MDNYYIISKFDTKQEMLEFENLQDALLTYRKNIDDYQNTFNHGAHKSIKCAVYCTSTTYSDSNDPFSAPEVTSKCEFICGFNLVHENQNQEK